MSTDASSVLPSGWIKPKIVGGTRSAEGRFGFQVAILEQNGFQYCGGSLIAPNVVLSAAHCFDPSSEGIPPVAIAHSCTDLGGNDCEVAFVESFSIFPGYNPATSQGDIAVVVLQTNVNEDPIAVTNPDFSLADDTKLTTIGWGATNPGTDGEGSRFLLEAGVSVANSAFCNSQYLAIASVSEGVVLEGSIIDEETMICTIADEKDACQGDSGGPLFLRCDATGEDVQVGIVSFGFGCAYEGIPGVFSRISNPVMFDFVNTIVQAEGHELSTISSFNEFCLVGGTQAPVVEEFPTPFPTFDAQTLINGWTCDVELFASQDGCDCNCGIPDPDCQFDDNVFGCRAIEFCNDAGECEANFSVGLVAAGLGAAILLMAVVLCVACCPNRDPLNQNNGNPKKNVMEAQQQQQGQAADQKMDI